nr:Grx4 family monothiol glutaredoxin [Bacteriovorax sp. HI3]
MSNPFEVVQGLAIEETDKSLDINTRIQNLISASPIFLFMKGTPDMPQCGFSANVIRILNHYHVGYKTFNILSDMDIREGVKQFSNWPTYPQLYVKGQLVGGNDIITELMQNGELEDILKVN